MKKDNQRIGVDSDPVAAASDAIGDREMAIDVSGATKRYGQNTVVDDLSVRVPTGALTGFIGPNGAGKSTTMRMLLGLTRPDSGRGTVLGEPFDQPDRFLDRVGAFVDGPAFYKELSGRRNLAALAALGGISESRVAPILERVGLGARADSAVREYSMGMRQRLGIGAALLPEPELLILDEPINGLDPVGVIEMRELLESLRDEGRTVLVSSHNLAELEQVCDHLIVISAGRGVYAGETEDLLDASRTDYVLVRAENAADHPVLVEICRAHGVGVDDADGDQLRVHARNGFVATLNEEAMRTGVRLVELHRETVSLEESYLALTEREAS
ncbi:MAG: ATP-binding cassette domain-containing protein [Gaiellaceae bacterium]